MKGHVCWDLGWIMLIDVSQTRSMFCVYNCKWPLRAATMQQRNSLNRIIRVTQRESLNICASVILGHPVLSASVCALHTWPQPQLVEAARRPIRSEKEIPMFESCLAL